MRTMRTISLAHCAKHLGCLENICFMLLFYGVNNKTLTCHYITVCITETVIIVIYHHSQVALGNNGEISEKIRAKHILRQSISSV